MISMSRVLLTLWLSPYSVSHYLALRCSFEVRMLSPFYRWRNWGLRRWNNLAKVILQVQVAETGFQYKTPEYKFTWSVTPQLFLAGSPDSSPSCAICWLELDSNRPLSFGGFEVWDPCRFCLCPLCLSFWTIKRGCSAASAGFREKNVISYSLGNSSWLPKAELSLILFPPHSQPCTVIYLQILHGGQATTYMNRK